MYTEIEGDLIALAKQGLFNVIAHGCNCRSTMRSGIAPKIAEVFHCDRFEMEKWGPTITKLGNIDYQTFVLGERAIWNLEDAKNNRNEPELTVVNAYTQNYYGKKNHPDGVEKPLDYEALTLCLRKMNVVFNGKKIGLPKIGAGLAKGDWPRIKQIIQTELKDCDVTVVCFNGDTK